MSDQTSRDLERRKYVRLRIRPDLGITPQRFEGRVYYVIKDPVSLRYYRFKEQEYFLLGLMDGQHTLDDAQKAFEDRFRPDRLTLEDLEHFGQQLLTAGLVQNESPGAGQLLFDRRKKRRKQELLQTFTNILYIKIPVIDPDRILTHMLKYLSWMFTTWFLAASILYMLSAVCLILLHFDTFVARLPDYHEYFHIKMILYLWAALGIVKVIHEFGHGLSCKAFGGEVHEMGFLLLCLSPAMYCNVSDSWTLPNKWHRIIIGGAGIYVELMIAATACFIWWTVTSNPCVSHMSLCVMVICSVSTVIFNGNPLMRYDGYYVLADWIEIPNLRDRANRYLSNMFQEVCLGIEVQPEPYMETGRKILFLVFAVVSWCYKWFVTFFILKFMASFLAPYKLEIISNFLALGALASMVGWPAYRLGQSIVKRGRLPDMKNGRVSLTVMAGIAVVLAFFLVPLPISRIREPGLVQFRPENLANVYVTGEGVLKKIHVREGEFVMQGKLLAEFENVELDKQMVETKSTIDINGEIIKYLAVKRNATNDQKEKDRFTQELQNPQRDLELAQTKMESLKKEKARLELKAPMAGVVIGVPDVDELGKSWEKGLDQPFCSIGDRSQLRVLVPVHPADIELMREDFERLESGKTIPVTIRIQGRVQTTWRGKINRSEMPRSEAAEIPLGLSSKGGGSVAVRPMGQNPKLIPQGQIYLVPVDFEDSDESICTNTQAQVKIHCTYRSAAWWVWRTLSSVFDLGLM